MTASDTRGWIDIHAHLDRHSLSEVQAAIDEAALAGVTTILSTATDLTSAKTVVDQCGNFPAIYGAIGISPFDIEGLPPDWEATLRTFFNHPRIVAVGEIGIDDSNPRYPPLDKQLPYFERQLALAAELDLPAVIHSRGAEKKAADICRNIGITKALFHCFTGDTSALTYIIESGYHVSFSGIITFSKQVCALVNETPLDRLFVETDTPYLAPVPHRGTTNRPAWVSLVGETVAKCKGITPEALQGAIRRNFECLFLSRATAISNQRPAGSDQ
jgi:TatD DNase family protein